MVLMMSTIVIVVVEGETVDAGTCSRHLTNEPDGDRCVRRNLARKRRRAGCGREDDKVRHELSTGEEGRAWERNLLIDSFEFWNSCVHVRELSEKRGN
jgi:hypothetical protein